MDGSIEYDREKFNDAIVYANKANSFVSGLSNQVSSTSNIKLPPNSPIASQLQGILNGLSNTLSTVGNYANKLKDMQEILENMENERLITELMTQGYQKIETVSEDGIKGIVLVPPGHNSSDKLPMITFLPGFGTNHNSLDAESRGLPYLANNGYALDSLIYVPLGKDWISWAEHGELIRAIDEVANKNNADKDRMVLMGYSMGGDAGYRLVANNPDYFSCYVAFSSSANWYGHMQSLKDKIASSGTTFITYMNSKEQEIEYNMLDQFGANVIGYSFNSAHEELDLMWSSSLLTDVINLRRGEKHLPSGNRMIKVSHDDMQKGSLESYIRKNHTLEGYGDNLPGYYVKLSNNNLSGDLFSRHSTDQIVNLFRRDEPRKENMGNMASTLTTETLEVSEPTSSDNLVTAVDKVVEQSQKGTGRVPIRRKIGASEPISPENLKTTAEQTQVRVNGDVSNIRATTVGFRNSNLITNVRKEILNLINSNSNNKTYEVLSITKDEYSTFIDELIKDGYKLIGDNRYIKDNIIIESTLNEDDLKIIINVQDRI